MRLGHLAGQASPPRDEFLPVTVQLERVKEETASPQSVACQAPELRHIPKLFVLHVPLRTFHPASSYHLVVKSACHVCLAAPRT